MNKWMWYFCVGVSAILLLVGVISKNTLFIIVAFILALLLKQYTKGIPSPKSYDKIQQRNKELWNKKVEREKEKQN